eukprot:1810822-Pleurochrysis_carterae.AAC.1
MSCPGPGPLRRVRAQVACAGSSARGGVRAAGCRACRSCERVLSAIARLCARRARARVSACPVASSTSRGRAVSRAVRVSGTCKHCSRVPCAQSAPPRDARARAPRACARRARAIVVRVPR